MYAVSERFLEVVAGSHRAVSRVRILTTTLFGVPADGVGTELPLISGDVKLTSTSDIKGTLDLTVPGDYWDLLQPYGVELFVERGIDYGDHTQELVPLGYYRVEDVSQDDAPHGPIRVSARDRIAQMQQNRVLYPYQVPDGTTHRYLFERLVNGRALDTDAPSTLGYGMFIDTAVPIHFDGYDPDAATVSGGQVVKDSTYEFLSQLADAKGCILIFGDDGELYVKARDRDINTAAEYAIRPGDGGNLIKASRRVARTGVYNIVSAYGSDPAAPTGYQLAYNNDRNSPLFWSGRFGAAPRYYASPLLRTDAQALEAAQTVLARYTGLPTNLGLFAVPTPHLRPLDVVSAKVGATTTTHTVDEVTVPLVGSAPAQVATRQLNPVGVVETAPDPTPTPAPTPDPTPTDPGTPTDPNADNPGDGTQAARVLGWGSVIDGDEFDYTGSPRSDKWNMYDGPGHAGNGIRSPSAFSVANGYCTIYGDNVNGGTTGGMAFQRDETYCRIEWRCRMYSVDPSAGGNRYHPVLIMWPTSDQWPQGGEYDFLETNCDSGKAEAFLHIPGNDGSAQEYVSQNLDIQNWHNYAFEWGPGWIAGWIDGVEWFRYTGSYIMAPGPMHPTFQLDNFYGSNMCPAKFEAMWVRIYQKPS